MTKSLHYRVVIEPLSAADGGGFLATAPDLVGCMSDGETPYDALSNIEDAITQWLDEAKRIGRAVPAPTLVAA